MKPRIHYTKPTITRLEIDNVNDAVANGWGENCYSYINLFEKKVREYLDVKFAIATSSCTGALHMGLAALNLVRGDEIILADTNWIATVSPISHLGLTPVFVDVLPDTWCLNPEMVKKAITPRTRAIIATHLYGNLCEMNELQVIADQHNIILIEDSAEALGSVFHGKHAGSMGKFAVFSFHGTKLITTGEGGIFVTNDEFLYEKVLTLSNHGRSRFEKKQFWPEEIGFKYKMSNIQAALGCAQIDRLEELLDRKREIYEYYKSCFKNISQIEMNPEFPGTINSYWMPNIVFTRESLIKYDLLRNNFNAENIDARPFFSPLSGLSMYKPQVANINSWDLPGRSINIPSYHDISVAEMDRVAEVIIRTLNER